MWPAHSRNDHPRLGRTRWSGIFAGVVSRQPISDELLGWWVFFIYCLERGVSLYGAEGRCNEVRRVAWNKDDIRNEVRRVMDGGYFRALLNYVFSYINGNKYPTFILKINISYTFFIRIYQHTQRSYFPNPTNALHPKQNLTNVRSCALRPTGKVTIIS